MPQRILIELLLFATPFALFLVYRLGSREVSVRDRWPLKVLTSIGVVFAVAALLVAPLLEPSNKGLCTKFARYEKGVTPPPEKINCNAGAAPAGDASTAPPSAVEALPPPPEAMPAPGPEPTGTMTPPNGGLNPG
jgi:hypothetical protein